MYLGPREKKRSSSPWRVLILLLLIAASIYVHFQVEQQQVEEPFIPTPTPTRPAISYTYEAEEWYLQGNLPEAIDLAAELGGIEGEPRTIEYERVPTLIEALVSTLIRPSLPVSLDDFLEIERRFTVQYLYLSP